MKYIHNLLIKKNSLFNLDLTLLKLYGVLSHNPQVIIYLNGINPLIEHLDIWWKMWNLILVDEPEKWSRFLDGDKSDAFSSAH